MLIIASLAYFFAFGVMPSKGVTTGHASLESRQLKPLQGGQESSYQSQQAFSCQTQASHEMPLYSKSEHQLVPKNYVTHSFFGIQNPWVGKKFFLDGAQPAWPGSQKQLEKKFFPTRVSASASESVKGKAVATCAYPTKTFHPEAKAQGGLDHDFEKALREAKSMKEAREMLKKEIQ